MKTIKPHALIFGIGNNKKEVIVQHGDTLFRLEAFAKINATKEDMEWMFKNYHPMLLKEGE